MLIKVSRSAEHEQKSTPPIEPLEGRFGEIGITGLRYHGSFKQLSGMYDIQEPFAGFVKRYLRKCTGKCVVFREARKIG